MEEWFCYRCKLKVVKARIPATYLKISRKIDVMKCPKCGIAFVMERDAVDLAEKERWLEQKT